VLALATLAPILLLTNLPHVGLATALAVSTLFMVVSSGRMVPAMALVTASAAPRIRGSFLSINASVQQAASGLAAALGGLMLGQSEGGEMTGFPLVGGLACVAALLTVWLAGRLRPAVGGEEATVVLDGPMSHSTPAVRMETVRNGTGMPNATPAWCASDARE
jgi:predicted MFS family arabinose efflux permease